MINVHQGRGENLKSGREGGGGGATHSKVIIAYFNFFLNKILY